MSLSTKLTAALLVLLPGVAFADGPDKQTPEEIVSARAVIAKDFKNVVLPGSLTRASKRTILSKYAYLDPKKEVPTDLLEEAVLFFDQNKASFPNQAYITVIDLGRKSDRQRFWVVDMTTGFVEKYWTIHGWGSDSNNDGFAEKFSNVINSGTSSLGFIRTAEIYSGKFKRSVRLDGLSSTNSNVRERAIVLHGWDDAHEKPVVQGLGWGCPALDWAVKDGVIDKVAEGSLMSIGVAK